jgi:FtsH-binding integral membrane protein
MAPPLTSALCTAGGITIFAINTKIDATKWGSMLMVAGFAFIALIFVGIFWINKIVYLVIAGVSALLFSAYLIYDIQLIMGGRTYSISPDEYVFAALSIYLVSLGVWLGG